jgi:hypothetical protein
MKFRAQSRVHLCKLSIVACSLGAFASFPDVALAQTCTEDADCAPEDYCDHYPSAGGSTPGAPGDSSGSADDSDAPCIEGEDCAGAAPPDEEEIAPPSEPRDGQCERGGRSCTSDDQCLLADHYCSFDDVDVATSTCPPGEECPDIELPPPSGRCEHVPYTCETDADCPEATVCGDDGECIFELQVCESADDCGARYECFPVSGGGSDSAGETVDEQDPAAASGSGSSGTPVAPDDPDAVDDPAASKPPESGGANPVASSEEPDIRPADEDQSQSEADAAESRENYAICFPKAEACESDDDCEGGWICAEAEVDGLPGWEGVERSCLPEGIAAVLAGDLETEGGGTAEDGSAEGEIPVEDEDTNENAEPIGDDDSDVIDSLGTQGGSEGSEGCSVSATPSRAGFGLGWLAAALGAGLFSRRRAATSATRGSRLPNSRE